MSSTAANEEGEFGFQIAPMVDVVFVLLLFFMACAGQTITEGLLKVSLPTPTPGTSLAPTITVDIDAAGNVLANGQLQSAGLSEHDLPALRTFLLTAIGANSEVGVIIRPSGDTKHERVIDILSACREARVKNILFR